MRWFYWALAGVLLIGGVFWAATANESRLEIRANEALVQAGLGDATVEVDGRDAFATVPAADAAAVQQVLDDVDGIRAVVVATSDESQEAAPASTTAQAAFGSSAASSVAASAASSASSSAGTSATVTRSVATSPASSPTLAPSDDPFVKAVLKDGRLTVSGQISDPAVAAGVEQVTTLIYAPYVENRLVTDEALPPAAWSTGLANALAVLPIAGQAELHISGDTATLKAATRSEQIRQRLIGTMAQVLGEDIELVDAVKVTGEKPPFYRATAPGDGTVLLEGVMPGEDVVDAILGSAVDAYGSDNVTNLLEVDEAVERSFTVFRLPLLFPQFAPIPQWQLEVDGTRISGGLRGGATFGYNSAVLTPELQQLASTAAGVMLRDPTLGIVIEGHTDASGSTDYNQTLSELRAQAGADFIVGLGVPPQRVQAVGYGEAQPIASNTTDEGRAANRRIDFSFATISG
jgi:outer membrane protein OmpA-like peptidoglycan-associated protein